MTARSPDAGRPVAPTMRWVIGAAAVLVIGAGAPLMLAPASTDRLFVFAIDPALTAAFLGANYWAAGVIELWCVRRRSWAGVRASLPGVLAFTTLTGIVSLVNLGQFDTSSVFTWIWLVVYLAFPVAIVLAWWRQRRCRVDDPAPVPASPALRALLGTIAIVVGVTGVALVVHPSQAGVIWAWALTTPDAAYRGPGGSSMERYVGCWLVGIGLSVGGALVENDAWRARPIFAGMIALLVLHGAAIARFPETIRWNHPGAWGFLAVIAATGAAGVWGMLASCGREVKPGA